MGKTYSHPLLILVVDTPTNHPGITRVGVIASRSIGEAVQRNRIRRRIKACLQSVYSTLPSGSDLLFLARKPIATASFIDIQSAVQILLVKAGLEPNDGSTSFTHL
jgi:ribonuclease P protein component